ncbi:MAG: SPOR domain-containing protein [Erythrobacter sp.]
MAVTTDRKTLKKSVRLIAGGMCAALAMAASPSLADVKAGVDAWSIGDFSGAVEQWQGPARQGDADALFNLAQAYRLGRGVTTDVSRARELYAEAASRGHIKAADNYGLLLFQQGQQSDAMPLIRAAAERGDPRAQYILGLAHFNGDYAEKDWVRAYALLTLSQSAGLPQALPALAQMDEFVPINQRQEAQLVARDIEEEAARLRAAQLATEELDRALPGANSTPAPRIAAAPITPVSAGASSSASTPVASNFNLSDTPGFTQAAPAPAPARVATPIQPQSATGNGPWRVQLGAFGVAGNADRLWQRLSGNSALEGANKVLVPAGNLTRLQAGGFVSRAAAQDACDSLKAQGQGCIVTRR